MGTEVVATSEKKNHKKKVYMLAIHAHVVLHTIAVCLLVLSKLATFVEARWLPRAFVTKPNGSDADDFLTR